MEQQQQKRNYFSSSKRETPKNNRNLHHNTAPPSVFDLVANSSLFRILPAVQTALLKRRPVVALESTLVAQGMPYPQNVELYGRVAQLLRNEGVEPATIALCNGKCHIGLTTDELTDLAQANPQKRVQKCSTRDLPLVLAQQQQQQQQQPDSPRQWGATTVASTMVLAHAAGISTFVTGGIGGVHRGAETSMDISADLQQLASTPVVVVSAGIKSILDIRKTLEVLETYSVPVVSYQSDEFPAFFSPHSNVPTPCRMDDPETIAKAFLLSQQLSTQLSSTTYSPGLLVGVPNDDPAGAAVEDAIQNALQQAETLGIRGRDVTPYILQQVAETTKGDSLRSNQHLVERNAAVGAQIAKALSALKQQERSSFVPSNNTTPNNNRDNSHVSPRRRVVVMGGIVVDRIAQAQSPQLLLYTSNSPATYAESDGGVARNIAEALGRLGSQPLFYSAVGGNDCNYHLDLDSKDENNDDSKNSRGDIIQRLVHDCGVHVTNESLAIVDGVYTPSYLAVLDCNGELHTALCANTDQIVPYIPIPSTEILETADFFVVDANVPTLLPAVQRAASTTSRRVNVFLEPTSVPKAAYIGRPSISTKDSILAHVAMISPNVEELVALVRGHDETTNQELTQIEQDETEVRNLCTQLLQRMNTIQDEAHIFLTQGSKGVLYAHRCATTTTFRHFPVEQNSSLRQNHPSTENKDDGEENVVVKVANATGAGDTFVGALLHALLSGCSMENAIRYGMQAALESIACSDRAVSPKLSEFQPPNANQG